MVRNAQFWNIGTTEVLDRSSLDVVEAVLCTGDVVAGPKNVFGRCSVFPQGTKMLPLKARDVTNSHIPRSKEYFSSKNTKGTNMFFSESRSVSVIPGKGAGERQGLSVRF